MTTTPHRIRCAGLLIGEDHRILLALEGHLDTGEPFWIPPGGGIEAQDSSALDCVRREMLEETGLVVRVEKLIYVREYVELGVCHTLELLFLVHAVAGAIRGDTDRASAPVGLDLRRHVEWFGRDDMRGLCVRPFELDDEFWTDYEAGFPQTRYLGAFSSDGSAVRLPAGPPNG
jgi:ADP-ribose pyrophosphatase YjhB (NUDIX family)